jgi:uncharacterized delta-60 repeat protein
MSNLRIVVHKLILIIGFLFSILLKAFCQPGSVDPSFGTSGIVVTKITSDNEQSNSLTLQPDKKILLSGYSTFDLGVLVIIRYLENGELDTTFNHNGVVKFNLNADLISTIAYSIQAETDGKIIISGLKSYNSPSEDKMLIIRLNSDGSFDDTFGNQGIVTLAPSDYERAFCIVIQSDGKYLIGGNSNFKSCVIRLKENGDYDTTFANNGRYTTDLNSSFSTIASLQFQSDGKIIAGGFRFGDSGYTEYALIRLTREGILDTVGFGVNGI